MLNVLIALWLIVSAFAWPHSSFQAANTIACGFVALALAIAGLYREEARYLSAAVAAWLFLSTVMTMSTPSEVTLWNNALVAIALLVTAFSGRSAPTRRARTA